MRSGSDFISHAPSTSLLRFLRSQSEEICFFTPSKISTCHDTHSKRLQAAFKSAPQSLSKSVRYLTTSQHLCATVESSLFNLDFLQSSQRHWHQAGSATAGTRNTWNGDPSGRRVIASRSTSTDTQHLLKRLWKPKARKEKSHLRPTDLPPLPTFLDDVGGANLGRNKTGKAANELKLRCTEFDSTGKVTLMDGEFKKTELIAKVRSYRIQLQVEGLREILKAS